MAADFVVFGSISSVLFRSLDAYKKFNRKNKNKEINIKTKQNETKLKLNNTKHKIK